VVGQLPGSGTPRYRNNHCISDTFKLGVVGILDREAHRRNEVDRVRWEHTRERIMKCLKRLAAASDFPL
jgi:hypothetical protein